MKILQCSLYYEPKLKELGQMMYVRKLILSVLIISGLCYAQPKLVVGIVVDQMRYDYLYRFQNNYGENGLKRLMREGANYTYAHYNYVPTKTAPGHASIYTGTTPFYHGIIGNDWYDRQQGKEIYSTDDFRYEGVGGPDKMSPLQLLTSTMTDQLKISNNGMSKVIAICIKDRGAILPGGRMADAAYWYSADNGNFMTSTYYMKELPPWVTAFNARKLPDAYVQKKWTLSFPIEKYQNSFPDENSYEPDLFQEGRTSFPHSLEHIAENQKYELLKSTPYGNQLLVDFARAAIEHENLGSHAVPDFLAISFSSTDYVGHEYGPNSVEIQDLYIKFDSQVAELLSMLDSAVGKGNYLLFLTADHGVDEVPGWGNFKPKTFFSSKRLNASVKKFIEEAYHSDKILEHYSNRQFYLNDSVMLSLNLQPGAVRARVAEYIRDAFPDVYLVYTKDNFTSRMPMRIPENQFLNGHNQIRSGDIIVDFSPNTEFEPEKEKANHSTLFAYDTHVPLLFYGWHVPSGEHADPVFTVDIAPTITNLIKITEPSGCIGIPLLK